MILLTLCLIVTSVAALTPDEENCKEMLTSYVYLCPGYSQKASPKEDELIQELNSAISVNRYVINALAESRRELEELRKNCTRCESGNKRIRCVDHGFTYGGRCYALLGLDSDNYITYDEAVAECTRNESLMAEIHDRFQQNAFQDYIRAKMPAGNSVVGIWIGMAYDSSTSSLVYRSGKQTGTSQFSWYSNFYPTESNSLVALDVRSDDGGHEGMWTSAKTTPLQGVLCERVL